MSITVILLIVIGGGSLLAWQKSEVFQKWIFNPYVVKNNQEYHRFFTSGLIHSDYMHLGFNLFVLYSFGSYLESYLNHYFGAMAAVVYGALFVLSVIVSEIPTFLKHQNNPYYNSLGASGAVAAIIFALIMFDPLMPIRFIFFPFFDIPGVVMGGLYLAYENYNAKRAKDNINHDAHFYGAVFGLVYILFLRPVTGVEFFQKIIAVF